MNTTKKLLVLAMVALLAAVSLIPSTFSWYDRDKTSQGGTIWYSKSDLPVSIKSAANKQVDFETYSCDANGVVSNNDVVTSVDLNADQAAQKATAYYKTTFDNKHDNDVFVDLNATNLSNNADFYIGTFSPTINEKNFASRPSKEMVSSGTTRVYFKTCSSYSGFWKDTNNRDTNKTLDTTHSVGNSNTTTCDINIAYKEEGSNSETMDRMYKCPNTDSNTSDGTTSKVFYFDLSSDVEYFYFFNHYYLTNPSNREWNRTIDITTPEPGTIYYLTGKQVDNKWKEYAKRDVDTSLVAVNKYYNEVEMSKGDNIFADISLKKQSVDESDTEFVPEYFGTKLSFESADSSKVEVDPMGIVKPKGYTDGVNVTTTIEGRFGDTYDEIKTKVKIPSSITQIPIIKNVKVPAGETVDVYWYARNKSKSDTLTISNFYITI